jgi:hypothetical protein
LTRSSTITNVIAFGGVEGLSRSYGYRYDTIMGRPVGSYGKVSSHIMGMIRLFIHIASLLCIT